MSDPKELLSELLNKHEGVALGEDHKSPEIFFFVRDNVAGLKKLGVETIFIEAVLSKDNADVQKMLQDGNDEGLRDYLNKRCFSNDLADRYFDVLKEYHRQGIKIVGIDIETNDRFKTGNKHWESVIQEHQKNGPGKYIILGGASHFGNTCGPGVNITLKIPSINFVIADDAKLKPSAKPSEEKFQGRSVADYEITLPKQDSFHSSLSPTMQNALEKFAGNEQKARGSALTLPNRPRGKSGGIDVWFGRAVS